MDTSGTKPDDSLQQPILSICIPTCNRAAFLKVMLHALLPQVKEHGRAIEVWILDNGSTDNTSEVLDASRELGPFHIHRQPTNIGPTRNIVMGPSQLASGIYTWVLGDHNLLRPNALAIVVRALEAHAELDAFYVNYRAATFPEHWPKSAFAGHEGPYSYVGNPDVREGVQQSWCDLLTTHSAACTQNYVHILRTNHWRDYWRERKIGDDYSDAESTYPHTVTVASMCFFKPCFVVSECMFTISTEHSRGRIR
jgi:glycosyltransferase involved in cell wall biosynthesis